MRAFILAMTLACFVFAHGAASAQGAPDLTGQWQVITSEWHSEKDGFNVDKPASFRFRITGQKRKIFWGSRTFWDQNDRKMKTVKFSGVICKGNEGLFIKEHGNGIAHGSLVAADKMYLYFMENDGNAKILFWEVVRME